jgi:phosphoribulokinase
VRGLLDFSIYLDLSDEVKIAWKIQRDMAERGHTLADVKQAIASRRPDFEAYIDPQKAHADVVIQILPTNLITNDTERKVLRVRLIQRSDVKGLEPAYLFDQGSTISWIPCGTKLTCSYPGIKLFSGPDSWCGQPASVLEIDGQFDRLEEIAYIENHLSSINTKFYGELTQLLLKNPDYPGSNSGTGLLQIIVGLKMRATFEQSMTIE